MKSLLWIPALLAHVGSCFAEPVRVVAGGDSITYGWIPNANPPSTRYGPGDRWPGAVISTDGVDGLHLMAESERKLGVAVLAQGPQTTSGQPGAPMPPGPNPNSQYRLGPDSMPQEGVPKGDICGPYTLPSKVYPGTQHTYWVYVPAQYDPQIPTALMILSGRAGFQRRERGSSGTERDG
jgi:hypothetical protein